MQEHLAPPDDEGWWYGPWTAALDSVARVGCTGTPRECHEAVLVLAKVWSALPRKHQAVLLAVSERQNYLWFVALLVAQGRGLVFLEKNATALRGTMPSAACLRVYFLQVVATGNTYLHDARWLSSVMVRLWPDVRLHAKDFLALVMHSVRQVLYEGCYNQGLVKEVEACVEALHSMGSGHGSGHLWDLIGQWPVLKTVEAHGMVVYTVPTSVASLVVQLTSLYATFWDSDAWQKNIGLFLACAACSPLKKLDAHTILFNAIIGAVDTGSAYVCKLAVQTRLWRCSHVGVRAVRALEPFLVHGLPDHEGWPGDRRMLKWWRRWSPVRHAWITACMHTVDRSV